YRRVGSSPSRRSVGPAPVPIFRGECRRLPRSIPRRTESTARRACHQEPRSAAGITSSCGRERPRTYRYTHACGHWRWRLIAENESRRLGSFASVWVILLLTDLARLV